MPKRSSKAKKDINAIVFGVVAASTGQASTPSHKQGKNPAAVALGRLGGLKGGKARAESLSQARRTAISKKAAISRWSKRRVP